DAPGSGGMRTTLDSSLGLGGEADDLAGVVGAQVDGAIGADYRLVAPARAAEHDLVVEHPVPVQREQVQFAAAEGAQQQLAVPKRELVAAVEGQAGGGDGRPPVMARLLHAFGAGVRGDLVCRLLLAEKNHRPTVVAAGADDVELAADPRSVLLGPDQPGVRIQVRT